MPELQAKYLPNISQEEINDLYIWGCQPVGRLYFITKPSEEEFGGHFKIL